MVTRVFEGTAHLWCDECDAVYLDNGGQAKDQTGPDKWFEDLKGRRVRVTVEVLSDEPSHDASGPFFIEAAACAAADDWARDRAEAKAAGPGAAIVLRPGMDALANALDTLEAVTRGSVARKVEK
jgi:hypothetical protein